MTLLYLNLITLVYCIIALITKKEDFPPVSESLGWLFRVTRRKYRKRYTCETGDESDDDVKSDNESKKDAPSRFPEIEKYDEHFLDNAFVDKLIMGCDYGSEEEIEYYLKQGKNMISQIFNC